MPHGRGVLEDRILRCVFAGLGNLGVTQALGRLGGRMPIDVARIEERESRTHDLRCDPFRGQCVLEDGVEAPEQGAIQQADMVGGAQDDAVGIVLLQKLQKGVQNAADFAHVVPGAALAAQRVELVEKVDAAGGLDRIEHQPEFGRGLAHVLGDESVELDAEEGQRQFAGKRRSGHGLAGARRAHQQQLPQRRVAMRAETVTLALLGQHTTESGGQQVGERHVAQARFRIAHREQARQFAPRLG